MNLFAEDLVNQFVEVGIVRKDDVAALIPHKSVLINVGSSVTTDVAGFLVKHPVVIAQFVKTVGRTQSGGSRSDNDNFFARHRFSRGIGYLPNWIQPIERYSVDSMETSISKSDIATVC